MRPPASAVFPLILGRASPGTGVQMHVENFAAYAARLGLDVRLITPWDAPSALVYPYFAVGRLLKRVSPAFWIGWRRSSHYRALRMAVRSRLRGRQHVVLYAQDALCARAALDLRDEGHSVEVVFIVHANGSEADEWVALGCIDPAGRIYSEIKAVEQDSAQRSDRIIFPSRFVASQWFADGPLPGKASCIPNFVFEPASPSSEAAALDGDLLTIGTLDARKNHDYLLQVLAAARRRGLQYRLTIAGDGPLRPHLAERARRLGISDAVTFAGLVPHAAQLLRRHRMYVHAAKVENCPVALIEALAAGRPIGASPVGGIPEIFDDDVEGVHWPLDDPERAADRLARVLEDAAVLRRMGSAARSRYDARHAPRVVGPRLLAAVLGTVAAGRGLCGSE